VPSIASWNIADFKSLGEAELSLPRLTVLAGANSSGKSSAIQSILLIAQSVSRGGRILMNGPLARLGLPKDVVRDGQAAIELGVTVQPDNTRGQETNRSLRFQVLVSLAPSADGASLEPVSFEIVDPTGEVVLAATSSRVRVADIEAIAATAPEQETTYLRLTIIDGRRAPSRMYLGFSGVVPSFVARHVAAREISRQLTQALEDALLDDRLPFELAQEVSLLVPRPEFLREHGLHEPVDGIPSRSGASPLWTNRDLVRLDSGLRRELVSRAVEARSKHEWAVLGPGLGYFGLISRTARRMYADGGVIEAGLLSDYSTSINFLVSYGLALQEFAHRVGYLGPLRDEPRVVQGAWDEHVDSLPVGLRGELTAEVLTREKNAKTRFQDWEGTSHTLPLPEAVGFWCEYFDIGDRIEVLDLGKLGRGVNIRVNGVERDLTMIGVGASQLLPILVASLAAQPGSLLLVEQPELHLHPSVQSKLADFFLFARPDIRFLVETHSEYMVTRIRRRVAEGVVDPAHIEVMFAERQGAATSLRSLALGVGGDFEDWPEGFFDTQDLETRFIVRAIAARLEVEGT
jgi:predicted ATPase